MVVIDSEVCTGCGACVKDCFNRNLIVKEGKAELVRETCIRCGHCVAICPVGAVQIPEYDMKDVTEIAEITVSTPQPDELLMRIKARRSVRQFKDKPVEPHLIERMLEAARYTATASNRQALTFVVVDKELPTLRGLALKQLAETGRAFLASESTSELMKGYATWWIAIEQDYLRDPSAKDPVFLDAPLAILIAGDNPIDAGLAAANIELLACAQGLGVLYSGFITRGFSGAEIKQAAGIPEEKEVLTAVLVGYPNVHYQRTAPRKPADIVWR